MNSVKKEKKKEMTEKQHVTGMEPYNNLFSTCYASWCFENIFLTIFKVLQSPRQVIAMLRYSSSTSSTLTSFWALTMPKFYLLYFEKFNWTASLFSTILFCLLSREKVFLLKLILSCLICSDVDLAWRCDDKLSLYFTDILLILWALFKIETFVLVCFRLEIRTKLIIFNA